MKIGVKALETFLSDKFGSRANFDPTEMMLYSHDIGEFPSLIKPFLGSSVPYAVVQPETQEEIVELVKWANENEIPLTPRGKATSGYGGAIPVKKGVVVDFRRLNKIVEIDEKNLLVKVQAGAVWESVDRELKKRGLTLRLYPTSYASSSVAGWLAQGGVGIGSYEAGWFKDNVISARVVLPSGEIKEFFGDELDLISDAEGITGFITEVTVKVQKKSELDVVCIGCPEAKDLQKLIEKIVEQDLPIWSLTFINPRMAELKNRAPLALHHGHPAEERVLLPASYIITLAFSSENKNKVIDGLSKLLKLCEAEILSEKIAEHEWKNRFKVMLVKQLGPSLVPSEFIIPLKALGDVLNELEGIINQPLVKEGVVIKKSINDKPEVAILGFIPADQRKFSYNFVFGLVLTIFKIAQKYGGRPYSTGLYFTGKARTVLGESRVNKLKDFKSQVDPKGIFNPKKVLGYGLINLMLGVAEKLEPFIRPFGNYVITQLGSRPEKPVRDIPPDVAWYAYACSQCGYCVEECDQFYGRGWESQSPRGKWYWLRRYMEGKTEFDQKMVDTFLVCTTCELCNLRCSTNIPIEPSWMKLRGLLIEDKKKMTFPPFEMMAAALKGQGNIWAGYRKNRTDWFPEDLKQKHYNDKKAKVAYFAGCTASYVEKDIAIATVRLLDSAGVDFTYVGQKENCCGTPMLVAGKWELFAETMKKNIEAIKEAGAETVVTSCPACDMMWRQVYPKWCEKLKIEYGIQAKHYSEILAEKIKSGEFKFPTNSFENVTVAWHDSCHIGRVSGVYEEPRELIKAVPNTKLVEMEFNRQNAHCCGSVLTLIKEPPIAADIGETRLKEAINAGASKVLALCPCCEFQFRVTVNKKNLPLEIVDLARFCAEALGYELPDPNPDVRANWAVFEKMIALMTPQGFANLMQTMWAEVMDAMPLGMGKMMMAIGKLGLFGRATLTAMKPLFPVLFPILLPKMMPKLMPTMLDRVAKMIPMPDYMREQMPELMPKVVDNLMPHMIGELVPLVSQPMINWLTSKSSAQN